MTVFLSKSVKLTLEVFLGSSYDLAYFHPDILIEAILIKKACSFKMTGYFNLKCVVRNPHQLNERIFYPHWHFACLLFPLREDKRFSQGH